MRTIDDNVVVAKDAVPLGGLDVGRGRGLVDVKPICLEAVGCVIRVHTLSGGHRCVVSTISH